MGRGLALALGLGLGTVLVFGWVLGVLEAAAGDDGDVVVAAGVVPPQPVSATYSMHDVKTPSVLRKAGTGAG